MERHPAKHPAVYACIVVICTVVGGIVGHFSVDYGSRGKLTVAGIILGCCLGIFLALLWGLLVTLADL